MDGIGVRGDAVTRVYAFVAPPSAALRASLTRRWGAHGERWGWWAPEGAEVPHGIEEWLAAMGLGPRLTGDAARAAEGTGA